MKHADASPPLRRLLTEAATAFASAFLIAFVLYAPVLDAFFIWDDITVLRHATPAGGAGLPDVWKPLANGFWRPIPLTIAWLTGAVFGPEPIAFHLIPVTAHALNAALLFALVRRRGSSTLAAGMVAAVFAGHFALFGAVSMVQNSMDVMLGTAVLGALLVADSSPDRFPAVRLAGVSLLGLGCKETGIIVPAIGVLWWLATTPALSREQLRRAVPGILGLGVLCAEALSLILMLQARAGNSYIAGARLGIHPLANLRQFLDYLFSIFFPYIHTSVMPFQAIQLEQLTIWIIRWTTLGLCVLVAAAMLKLRGRRAVPLAAAGVGAGLLLIPAGLLDVLLPPQGRFLYAPAVLVFVAFSELFALSGRAMRGLLTGIATASFIFSAIAFYSSPTVEIYRETARRVQVFVLQARAVSGEWEPGQYVAIFDYPHPGDLTWRWLSGQALLELFIPVEDITLRLDQARGVDHAYWWGEDGLTPVDRAFIINRGSLSAEADPPG